MAKKSPLYQIEKIGGDKHADLATAQTNLNLILSIPAQEIKQEGMNVAG
jgi:hypothetical protein